MNIRNLFIGVIAVLVALAVLNRTAIIAMGALAILVGLLYALWKMLFPGPGKPMFCGNCGHEGPTKTHTRGNLWIELALWLLMILPGVFYSIWRHTTRKQVCESCGSDHLLPVESPMARMAKRQLESSETVT